MRLFLTEDPSFGNHAAVQRRLWLLKSETDHGECAIHTVLC